MKNHYPWTGRLNSYNPHEYCQKVCAEKRNELWLKMKNIYVKRVLERFLVVLGRPHYFVGRFEGCCKWDAISRACDQVERDSVNEQ